MAAKKKTSKKKTLSKKKSSKKHQPKPFWKILMRLSIYGLLGVMLFIFILFGLVYLGLFGPLPTDADLKEIKNNNASEIFSADGILIGKYFLENRSSIDYDDIPDEVINALVATEDSRFFEHSGIDFYSIPRVVIKTLIMRDKSGGGGSTISQQLVKNLFGRKNYGALSMPVNKLKENITALKLEDVYSKQEIITLYLNTVSFGENVYGIKAASQRFFSKNPHQLNVEEAATLVGMLKANTLYMYPEASKNRRNTVLALMAEKQHITADELAALQQKPLALNYQKIEGQHGIAPYLRAKLENEINTILSNTSKSENEAYNLYTDGLIIELTINSTLQREAEIAVRENMKKLQSTFDKHWMGRQPWGKNDDFLWSEAKKSNRYKQLVASKASEEEIKKNFNTPTKLLVFTYDGLKAAEMSPLDSVAYHQMILQSGFFAMNAHTGEVLAYVGGIDFGIFPHDHVYGKRQVGSTFKPFVYAAAIESGVKPCDYIENEKIIFSNYDNWSPENANGQYGGYFSVKGGLTYSVNTVAARLISETGPTAVIDVAKRMGVESHLPNVPSIALGVADISLYEMVKSYTAFVENGKNINPIFIKKITTAHGEVLYESKPTKPKQAIEDYTAHAMRNMLQLVVDSGTARSARTHYGVKTPMGGKTGTTQNNADGWFMAITPNVVCGAWVGAQSPVVRFRTTALGQGAATALPIVATWIKKVETNKLEAKILGKAFPQNSVDLDLDLLCPLYIESKGEEFIDRIFNSDRRQARREIKQREKSEKEGGWMKRLIEKLKKKN